MSAVKSATRHACNRCGKNQRREDLIFSGHSRSYYCRSFSECDRRVARQVTGGADRAHAAREQTLADRRLK